MARIARWFLDITLDSETLRWWSGTGDVTFGGQTYTGLGTRFITPESLKRKASLKSEKVELEFDSSRQSDNSDPIGHLLDQNYRNRAIRLRRVAWLAGQTVDAGETLADERGRIRNIADGLQRGKPAILTMELESGALAYLERRMETRSPASQNIVFPEDKGFDLIAQLEGVTLPWRTKYKKAGTVRFELDEEYTPYPREMQIGRFVTPGSFIYADTNQQQRKSLCQVFALADHRIKSLDRIWINGKLERSTPLVHGQRTLQRVENDKGEDRCWVTFYDGRPDQVADPFLVSVASTWTSAHRLRGIAYIIVEHRWDSDMANAYDYRFGGEGGYFYDRRQDSTAGGSGTQRWDQPLTWGYTTNAAVISDHYRSGIRVIAGADHLWFGVGEALDAVPYAEFEALADLCDVDIALKNGGTQKQYEVNGTLSAKNSHDKNLQKLADQMAARAIDQGGRISFRPPVIRTPVVTLTDADLVRDSESQLDTGANIDDMVNTIEGRFVNPANDYKNDDYPKVQIADYVDADNGEISDTLNFDLEISAERAQRIAKLKIEDSRRILVITETYGTKAKAIEPGEWFVRQSTLRGFPSGKTFVADEVTRFIDGSMEVVASEVDPAQLVWDEETAVDLSEPPAFPQLTLEDLETPSGTGTQRTVTKDDVSLPGVDIEIGYAADALPYETDVEVTRDDGAGGPASGAEILRRTLPAGQTVLTLSGELMPGTAYVFRARAKFDGRVGDWSAWIQFTTPSTYAVPASTASAGSQLASDLDDLSQGISDLVDTYGETASAAASAAAAEAAKDAAETFSATSSAAATASEAARDQSQAARDAAEDEKDAAILAAGQSSASATAAAGSASTASAEADDAAGSAAAAAADATIATTKAGEASVSASQAATSESNAAGSASSAASSATVSASARDAAQNLLNQQFPPSLEPVARDSYEATWPYTIIGPDAGWPTAYLADFLPAGTATLVDWRHKATMPRLAGRRIRAECWIYSYATNATFRFGINDFSSESLTDADYKGTADLPAPYGVTSSTPASPAFILIAAEFVMQSGWQAFVRPFLQVFSGGAAINGQFHAGPIRFTDVTSETASADSATASADSASSAAASETEAAQQASASAASATLASTKAGEASTFADQAALSETNAAGSASTATSQAGLSATARQASEDAQAASEAARDESEGFAGTAGGHASAAAGSASTASAKADEAEISAAAASASAVTASTQAGLAEGHADDAEGFAAASAASASQASASETAAGQSASASETAKQEAQTARGQAVAAQGAAAVSESNAAGSASSAAANATLTATARDAAQDILYRQFPPTLAPGSRESYESPSAYTIAGPGDWPQPYISEFAANTASVIEFRHKRLLPNQANRRYRVETYAYSYASNSTFSLFLVDYSDESFGNPQFIGAISGAAPEGVTSALVGQNWVHLAAEFETSASWQSFLRPYVAAVGGGSLIDGIIHTTGIRITDVTSEVAAAGSATASANSASSAAASETEAGVQAAAAQSAAVTASTKADESSASADASEGFAVSASDSASTAASQASLTATYLGQTETARDATFTARDTAQGHASDAADDATAAATSASVASGAASTATAKAAEAQSYTELSAQLIGAYANSDPTFLNWPGATGTPTNWSADNSTGGTPERVDGTLGPYGMRLNGPAGSNMYRASDIGSASQQRLFQNQWWVIDATAKLNSGTLEGAGAALLVKNSSDVTVQVEPLSFSTTVAHGESAATTGTVGKTYRFSKLLQVTAADAYFGRVFAAAHWGTINASTGAANSIEFDVVGVRPATAAEIENKTVLEPLEASVSTLQGALATVEGAAAYHVTEVAASGSDPAIVSLKAGKDGSEIGLAAKILRLINNVGGTTIEVMRAVGGYVFFSNPVSIDRGGKRLTIGPNSDVVFWFGPDTTAPPSQTRTNGHWAFGTDAKVYYGSVELASGGATADDKAVAKKANGAATTNGTTWVTLATADMTVGTSGIVTAKAGLFGAAGADINTGTLFYGEWRVIESTQAAPGSTAVVASGTFTAEEQGVGFVDIVQPTNEGDEVATYSGACRYRLQIRRASGSNNIGGNGVDGFLTVDWRPQG